MNTVVADRAQAFGPRSERPPKPSPATSTTSASSRTPRPWPPCSPPGAVLHNAHDDFRMSDADFLSLLGVGRAGRTEIVQTLTSGATAVLRKTTAWGGEILLVVQTDGGCVTGVTSFYD